MKKFRFFLVMLVSLGLVTPAYAANIYKDRYTTEDSSGNWTYSGTQAGQKKSVTLIATSSDTTSTVTTAKSGGLFVLTGTTGPAVGGIGYVLTLPTAASGLEYTFTTATNQTIAVRTAAATDIMYYGSAVGATKFTSPASTGSTITVVGTTNKWFVTRMTTPTTANGTNSDWTSGAR